MSGTRTFVAPFAIGTLIGILSGTILGAFFGKSIFSFLFSAWDLISRKDDDQVPFDLLLQ